MTGYKAMAGKRRDSGAATAAQPESIASEAHCQTDRGINAPIYTTTLFRKLILHTN